MGLDEELYLIFQSNELRCCEGNLVLTRGGPLLLIAVEGGGGDVGGKEGDAVEPEAVGGGDGTSKVGVILLLDGVAAVDGNGGIEYREAFNARYEGSEVFRNMIWNLSVCWMLAFYVLGAVVIVLVLELPVASVYAVGWAGPFPVAGLMVVTTIFYVKSVLRLEGKEENGGDGRVADDESAPLLSGGS